MEIRPRLTSDEYEVLRQYRELKQLAYKGGGDQIIEGDEAYIESVNARSLEDIVKEFKIDTNLWESQKFTPGGWTTPIKGEITIDQQDKTYRAKLPIIIKNRKSTAVFKKKTNIIDYEGFKRNLINDLKKDYAKGPVAKPKKTTGNLLEVTIPDLHLGKFAWKEETGNDYDIKKAVSIHDKANDVLLQQAQAHKPEEILLVFGNDLFNSDTAYPTTMTTRGTYQQDDTRWQKVFRTGYQMCFRLIDRCKRIAPVKVKMIPGNHDYQKTFYLGEVLEMKYENDPGVEIDNSPHPRKWHKWGKNLIGFAHGNRKDEGEERLIGLAYNEASRHEDVKWVEVHAGDIHHYKEIHGKSSKTGRDKYAEDINGVILRHLKTLMLNDEWETRSGYHSQKGAHFFVWNKDRGNTAIYNYNL
jgi:hypothetical protein